MTDIDSDRIQRLNDFVRRMNAVERDLSHKVVRPKDAATLILVDRSGSVPKVLLGKRHARHKFMPGKFVFPGGGVDPTDKAMPVASALDPQSEMRLMQRFHKGSPVRARALALAAVRETFEETGCCSASVVRRRKRRPAPGPTSRSTRCSRISATSTSSAAPSPRRDGSAASTRASSPWKRARSPTASRA